jgi:pimeloyl-ACP methyl ester carboxylesterase/DNA-binding winged helix-turn-helix (wHTH) protein
MTIVFDEYELDPARRELRVDGEPRSLQPQVFDLLLYLVENRERVVPKKELLEKLWPDTVVTEGSLQRAVSLARSALGERGAELIQTYPRQGYRFVGKASAGRTAPAESALLPRYAKSGDVHIAYAAIGEGEIDIVIVNGWIMPMRAMFRHPSTRAATEAIAQLGRVITFDKRGTGLSDRVKELPSHEQRMDDLRVVLDACGSKQAILVGFSEGGALAMLCAATYPERIRGLVLCGAFARMTREPDYPCGYATEDTEKLKRYIRRAWGRGASLRAIAPSQQNDPVFASWVAFAEQEGSSPGGALDLLEMNLRLDLRALLPSIRVPTVVMQAADDKMIHPGSGAYLAEHIPNAKYIEAPGDDHVFFFATRHRIVEALRWILSREPAELQEDRFLSTVLAAHPHGDAEIEAWRTEVERFRGFAVPGALQAYFDGPIRALHCGAAVTERLPLSCGVHTGEVVRAGAVVSGPAFIMAEALAARAPQGQLWASRVLADLVPGADLVFAETGQQVAVQGRQTKPLSVERQR